MNPQLVHVAPAGEFLADELSKRGWSQNELAEILGRPAQFVSEIISGKKEITRDSAAQLEAALGMSAESWLNLQNQFHLAHQRQDARAQTALEDVRVRARLNELAPIGLLKKRGLLRGETLAELSAEICDLFDLPDIRHEPTHRAAAKRANVDERLSNLQQTWIACARRIARLQGRARKFSPAKFEKVAENLGQQLRQPKNLASLQSTFATAGVKLVYLEAFAGSKIDGASFMDSGTPVIALSGRGKRFDKVVFTLFHEVAHVLLGHIAEGEVVVDEEGGYTLGIEKPANERAQDLLLGETLTPPAGRITSAWVRAQAEARGIHPLLIVGQLQYAEVLSWRTPLVRNAPTATEHITRWK